MLFVPNAIRDGFFVAAWDFASVVTNTSLGVNMTPDGLNVAFAITPLPGRKRPHWVEAIGATIILPDKFDIGKQYCVNLLLKRLAF
jgi:hypothetical protein